MVLGRSLRFFGLKIRLIDIILLSTLSFFFLLNLISPSRSGNRMGFLMGNGLAAFFYIAGNTLAQKSRSRLLFFLLRTASVQLFFLYLYSASLRLQLILISSWQDQVVLDLEQFVFGVQPTVWIQQFITPWLTEWMMFCYVFYVPIYPILCAIIYRKHGEEEMENYLFFLGLATILCAIGFMLFPVAGPMRKISHLYSISLEGFFFTSIGELIRNHVHMPGGTIPSPHCALVSVMWWMAYRYSRPCFYVLAPIVISVYVSTVYARFHYLLDVVTGILAALLAVALGIVLIKAWNRISITHFRGEEDI